MTARDVIWIPWQGPGLEHLRLEVGRAGVHADGLVVGLDGDRPFRLRYHVRCDPAWRVREVQVASLDTGGNLHLVADGGGAWSAAGGTLLPRLDGCLGVDLSASPFTNTLPIRRLALAPGQSADIAVAYIALPALTVTGDPQRYRCLERGGEGSRYRFESLDSDFAADLPIDADGLVLDYPGLFRRLWSG